MTKDSSIRKHQRSHSGCDRCKRRRQKCDESRPICGRCSKVGVACEYSINLRWGGRTFDRSRFGDCLKGGARRVSGDKHEFVYTGSFSPQEVSGPIPTTIQAFPSLSMSEERLLFHFTSEASRVTCCSPHVQAELCSLIVPMAVESPALMNATLSWAALHSISSRGRIPGRTMAESNQIIANFKTKSIENLRKELQAPNPCSIDALLATVRTLCQCEIHSGSDQLSTWRVHIRGAKALMNMIEHSRTSSSAPPRLLSRWYASLDSLSLLAPSDDSNGDSNRDESIESSEDPGVYLDDYNGYSTDLSRLLGRIGKAKAARRREITVSEQQFCSEADFLEEAIFHIMERDNSAPPSFYPGVLEKLSPQAVQDYAWCNQAYQQTALLHIRRRLRRLPSHSQQIQDSVKIIIECVRSIAPSYGLSPTIVLTTPLFTAGCEALGEDRVAIKQLLTQLYESLKIRNIKLALEVLENYWENSGVDEDVEIVLRRQNWDFIPY
ncbi:related to C6 finger domain protein [Phialocephala subalpina]|uniref:Related to C6 finger domain protein n=1 Tax=Phialocephala subalpina TaxID=576137 RepID=A0A1L7WWF1_9HELO|nr:related to C6 finger domain protein [Phialocephala subalpina]